MIGGTSGSEANLCQPSRSQSKMTHTRSSWLGSRNTCAPLEPCCLRFSAPLVEKTLVKRSKSSTVVVARSISVLLLVPASPNDAEAWASIFRGRLRHIGKSPYTASRLKALGLEDRLGGPSSGDRVRVTVDDLPAVVLAPED